MKNMRIHVTVLSFLFTVVSMQAMEEKKEVASLNSRKLQDNRLAREADRADDRGDYIRSEELVGKSLQYERFQESPKYSELIDAVLTRNTKRETAVLFELIEDGAGK